MLKRTDTSNYSSGFSFCRSERRSPVLQSSPMPAELVQCCQSIRVRSWFQPDYPHLRHQTGQFNFQRVCLVLQGSMFTCAPTRDSRPAARSAWSFFGNHLVVGRDRKLARLCAALSVVACPCSLQPPPPHAWLVTSVNPLSLLSNNAGSGSRLR